MFLELDKMNLHLAEKEAKINEIKSVLADCTTDLLEQNHLTRSTVECEYFFGYLFLYRFLNTFKSEHTVFILFILALMKILKVEFEINEQNLNSEVGEIEPIGLV